MARVRKNLWASSPVNEACATPGCRPADSDSAAVTRDDSITTPMHLSVLTTPAKPTRPQSKRDRPADADTAVICASPRKRLDRKSVLMLAVDVETHDWEEDGPMAADHVGQFGHLSFIARDKLQYSRIVQFGWVIFKITNQGVEVEQEVQQCTCDLPVHMSNKAKNFHHLRERDLRRGQPMRAMLARFGRACITVERSGGKMIAHHLEFDAGLIAAELRRARMGHILQRVERMAREGICTFELVKSIPPFPKYAGLKTSCRKYGVPFDGSKHHSPLYDATKAAQLFGRLVQIKQVLNKRIQL